MKFNGILTLVVTVLAVVLISTACIVPVVQSAQSDQHSSENNIDFRYASILTDSEIILSHDGDGKPMLNGQLLSDQLSDLPSSRTWAFVVADSFLVRSTYQNGTFSPWQYFYYDSTNSVAAGRELPATSSIVCSDGVASVLNESQEIALSLGSYSFLLVPSETGKYAEYQPTFSAFVDNNSTIYAVSATSFNTWTVGHGTLEGFALDHAYSNGSAFTPTIVLDYSLTEDEVSNVFKGTATSSELAFQGYFVPIEYTTITDNDSVIIAMLGIIPVLLFVVPIMIIVRSFNVGRD